MDSKALLAAGTAVLALGTLVVVLAHDDREPAIPMAIAAVAFLSLFMRWPTPSKWHTIGALAVLGAAAGYLLAGGFNSFATLTSVYVIVGTIAIIYFLGREEKLRKAAAEAATSAASSQTTSI